MGFDDLELAELLTVPVTVVAYDAAELGCRDAEVLCRRLGGYDGPADRRVLQTEVVTRGSGELVA